MRNLYKVLGLWLFDRWDDIRAAYYDKRLVLCWLGKHVWEEYEGADDYPYIACRHCFKDKPENHQ